MKLQIENFNAELKGFPHDDMSDEEFFNFCQQNQDLKLERDQHKQIFIMAPTGFYTGALNSDINTELNLWNRKSNSGKVFDSSTRFTLPDGAVFSPDAAWVSHGKMSVLTEEQKNRFAPVCPDFIIELKCPFDNLNALRSKMLQWIENGTRLAWLIDPKIEQVFIYREDNSIEVVKDFSNKLSGENILPGFELNLRILQ